MSILSADSAVYGRTQALCEALIADPQILALKAQVDAFLNDTESRALFDCLNKFGEELSNKQMAGMPPSEDEMSQFRSLQQDVYENPVCRSFLEARNQVDGVFSEINRFFGLTLESNSVPTLEQVDASVEMAKSSGCCGGGECGDCSDEGCDKEGCGCGQ